MLLGRSLGSLAIIRSTYAENSGVIFLSNTVSGCGLLLRCRCNSSVGEFALKRITSLVSPTSTNPFEFPLVVVTTQGGYGPDGMLMRPDGILLAANFRAGEVLAWDAARRPMGSIRLPPEAGLDTTNIAIRAGWLYITEGDKGEIGVPSVIKLVEEMDKYIPIPKREIDKPFLMPVEDVFSISGRGTVVTGRVETGIVKVGEEVEIVGLKDTRKTVVTGVEMFRKLLDQGEAGDNVGALVRGVAREEVERGQVLCKPGSVTPHTEFNAEVYVLSKDEGGRHTPFFANYRPQFYFRTTDVTGEVILPEGTEMVMPGDNVTIGVKLIAPIAMDQGLRFAIREGGRTVGSGVVSTISK